jgi:hypothetical protein
MPLVIRAFPLRRPVAELQSFAATLSKARSADADRFYKQYGVSHESWHLQDTPAGPWVIGVTMVDNPQEAAPRYAQASEEFDSWFKSQVLHLTGVDVGQQPLGPPTQQIFAWSDKARINSNLTAPLE